jgi:hypothetical protein
MTPAKKESPSASPAFRAVVKASGKTATGIQVPAAVVEHLGTSRKPAVRATINNYTYRTAGDDVDVRLELDTEVREVTVPPDFADALTRNAPAKRFSTRCPTAIAAASCCPSKARRPTRRASAESRSRSPCCATARSSVV